MVGAKAFRGSENVATRAALDDDLSYWRDLGRAQARLIDRIRGEKPERWHRQPSASTEAGPRVGDPGTREWRLRDIDESAALNSTRIVLLGRALTAARKSEYSEPGMVFAALEVLASTYPGFLSSDARPVAWR